MAIAGEKGRLISADKVEGTSVVNAKGENLGHISEIMIDKISGGVAYAVLKYGSVIGMGGKLFALPWEILKYDTRYDAYVVDIPEDKLKRAPSFDADNPPDMADPQWSTQVRRYYGVTVG
ncbi:MAG TPA: PRC-barrel domain-containing protein [Alphaproteobacteria bacterium]|nr:PRC-barrel domain-containing protein [Alphaproteobacteria bacterium]